MLKRFVKLVGGDPNQKEISRLSYVVNGVNDLETEYEALKDVELTDKTEDFRSRLASGDSLDTIMIEAFAAVREASKRTIGLRHYDVQLIGGAILHQRKIVEMKTGEGKTLVATLPIYLNALSGKGVHLITVNDYLARRDARWMAPIYNLLGLSVGVLQMAARTESGKKAFLVDLESESPHEDQHQLKMVARKEAYLADITYGTNSEFGFDYLRDNMTMKWENRVQRGHHYAIIDEVDNVLIDEARTPLIISGPAQDEADMYIRMAQVVKSLRSDDFEVNEKDRNVTLTELGETHVEDLLGMSLGDPDRPEDITPEQARTMGYLEQALRAQYLYKRNKEYLVQAGKVVIVDDFTGRLMPGRRWSDGLHQAVEAKEGVKVQSESVTYATITIQNYFRMYEKLAGMTGTAVTEVEEFDKIYSLDVLALPTNLEYQASQEDSDLVEIEDRDLSGYKFVYYAARNDKTNEALFWKRKDYPDVVYRTEEAKLRAIAGEVLRYHALGRPMLVGTTSVELSDLLSRRLKAEPLRRLCQVLLIRKTWYEQNDRVEDGRIVEELQFLNVPLKQLNTAELRKYTRDLDISFNPEDERNIHTLLSIFNLSPDAEVRLRKDLQGGIPHEVLNARKHTEESQIIAGAGAFGAVTIATNMAGRGVDIKLGGELAEEILAAVNRILRRAGYEDPYEMSLEERYKSLQAINPEEYGIYETEINYFNKHINDMFLVRKLGGLHVIGSERHDARRIDNQLRGRSSRQGDPGSSRFYLSMDDELMRLFGGGQADALMQRMKIDDALPLEAGLVSRIVEQAQSRVEGANFDVRKHLLEYDDVLNTQRTKIYQQRDLIFQKEDLSENVSELLQTEVNLRIPEKIDDEGAWKLLAWLDQIQPSITSGYQVFPSYTLKLISDEIESKSPFPIYKEALTSILLGIAANALNAEQTHLLNTVQVLLDRAQENLDQQLIDRMDALDIFIEGLSLNEEPNQNLDELSQELTSLVRVPIRVNHQLIRELGDDPDQAVEDIRTQVENLLIRQTVMRLIGSVERRLEESIDIDISDLQYSDWDVLKERILSAVEEAFISRKQKYLGDVDDNNNHSVGSITRDLKKNLEKVNRPLLKDQVLQLLLLLPQGTRATFDKKTHRRVFKRTTRFSYVYYAASFVVDREREEIISDVLAHLADAQKVMNRAWGYADWQKISNIPITDISNEVQLKISNLIGEEKYESIKTEKLSSVELDIQELVRENIGNRVLTEIYRQLIIRVISDLWVEYLTQMEALRVSIGLEAYAQRDPLVQYKNRAYELYQELLNNVRASVINRMFTFKPRDTGQLQDSPATESQKPEIHENREKEKLYSQEEDLFSEEEEASHPEVKDTRKLTTSQKRRRRRRRK